MRWKILFLFAFSLLATSCAKSDSGRDCVNSLCTGGTTMCMGNYKATCSLDGRSWQFSFCGERHVCENGACKQSVCVPGLHFCESDTQATACNNRGTAQETTDCDPGTTCQYGFCLPKNCKDGQVHCNIDEIVVCSNGWWTHETCPQGQVCSEKQGKCVKKICTPFQRTCFQGDATTCDYNGGDFTVTKCKSNETCVNGFCLPKVCQTAHDAVVHEDLFKDANDMNTDTSIPDTSVDSGGDSSQPGPNKAVINGSPVEFVTHTCAYSPAQLQLRCDLKAAKVIKDEIPHQDHVVILLTGIQENQTGQFTCQGQGDVRVNIYYKWGKHADNPQCADYDYIATKCTVNIDAFGMSQGIVSGSFEAPVMQDCTQDNTTSVITKGVFNANRQF